MAQMNHLSDLARRGDGFTFIDLFAGIGGFAAVLQGMGGRPVYSVEIDQQAARIYKQNWGHDPLGDITQDANDEVMNVPPHDVLAAGFPCQPFSKSGAQRGMEETRGTLFWNILKIIQAHHPKIVLLENVRNLAGPRHTHEWDVIIKSLRAEGYVVSSTPAVFSPHLLPRELGGRPQIRERVFITATYAPDVATATLEVDPPVTHADLRNGVEWDLKKDLPLIPRRSLPGTALTDDEELWFDAWDAWVKYMWRTVDFERKKTGKDGRLPGFPVWVDAWVHRDNLVIPAGTPEWKTNFLRKNSDLYTKHQAYFDAWLEKFEVPGFPPSRRKFEWQAQNARSVWDCVLQLRPSGIRVKRATHLPALVAITQTSIYGPYARRLSPTEVARLQGLPDSFSFAGQATSATLKQLGNGVNLGAVWYVLKQHVQRDAHLLKQDDAGHRLLAAVNKAPESPDEVVSNLLMPLQNHERKAG